MYRKLTDDKAAMRLIGRRFREFRENLGLGQKEMAGVCTLTQASISNFINTL